MNEVRGMFWSIDQAAEKLNKPRFHVNYLIKFGKLSAIRIGKLWRIAPGDVENYEKQLPVSSDCQKKILEKLPTILTVQEVADCFDVDRRTVCSLITLKDIPSWKEEKGWCFARCDLIDYCFKKSNLYG
jgi:excisionase family DNA binding protein